MAVAYYFVMGLLIGFGAGSLLPESVQAICVVVGFVMAVLTVGWYGHNAWASIKEETEESE
jgi:hydrogenase/urease accessory protein HupE